MIKKKKHWILLFSCTMGLTSCGFEGISTLPGRPLHIQGEAVRTELQLGKSNNWTKGPRPNPSNLDDATRIALEELWLQDARGEHASIPAFSRISWQLVAIGAPPELLESAHKAALEEIKHAQLCFALAEGYGNHIYSVQPMPKMLEGGLDFDGDPIEVIAKETLFDGCLLEGFFAKLASVAVLQCEEPATLSALKQIASEEASHTAFSWSILKWLLQQHPTKVEALIQKAEHDFVIYSRPKATNSKTKHLVNVANPYLLIKHGRLPDSQWQKIWDEHVLKTQKDLQQLLQSIR